MTKSTHKEIIEFIKNPISVKKQLEKINNKLKEKEIRSNCCNAEIRENSDFCTACGEHCAEQE